MTKPTRIDIDNGKYTIVFGGDPHVPVHFLRYGEDWIRPGDLQASNAWIAAACEIEDLRSKIENNQAASARLGFEMVMDAVSQTAVDAGWYTDVETGQPIDRNFGEVVALMHSELSEALEADRKGLRDDKLPHRPGQEVELADCVIRIMDTCKARGYDLFGAIIEKNAYNRLRADHKIEARANGGKKY
jgi:hypothetical protein